MIQKSFWSTRKKIGIFRKHIKTSTTLTAHGQKMNVHKNRTRFKTRVSHLMQPKGDPMTNRMVYY